MRARPPRRDGVADVHIDSAVKFLDVLSPRHQRWKRRANAWVFRGQMNAEWKLAPLALRDINVFSRFGIDEAIKAKTDRSEPTAEMVRIRCLRAMLEQFATELDRQGLLIPQPSPRGTPVPLAPNHQQLPTSAEWFPLMALAQHHGLPTVLLDWTRRAWVAAYFAAADAANNPTASTHLAVWALFRENVFYPLGPYFYEAPAGTNPNLRAQQGLFTWFSAEHDDSLEALFARTRRVFDAMAARARGTDDPPKRRRSDAHLYRFMLPVDEAPKLLRLLAEEGVSGASMFPGADGVVRGMRERAWWR